MTEQIEDYLKKNLNIPFNENKKIIIFGDSHSKCFYRKNIIWKLNFKLMI